MSNKLPEAALVWKEEAQKEKARLVWITPTGQRFIRVPQVPPPRYVAVQHDADGKEEFHDWSCYVKSGHDLPERLGLDIDHQTLLRLVKAGFIGAVAITPRNYLISLTSLDQFLRDAADPAFWTQARRREYSETNYGEPWI